MPLRLPENLKVKIMAVRFDNFEERKKFLMPHNFGKVILDRADQPEFIEVGLMGGTEQSLVNGKCTFQALKFKTTSFNHSHCQFHIVVVVFADESS